MDKNPKKPRNETTGLGVSSGSYMQAGWFVFVLSIALFLLISIFASIVYSLLGGHRNEELARFTKKYPRNR